MIVLGLILFVFAGWGFAWCLCRTAGCDEPACGEQLSHVRLIVGGEFVDVVTLMDGDAGA